MQHKADPCYHQPSEACLLDGQLPLPAAIIRQSALHNNIYWMQTFAERAGLKLAPHGKTSMTPEIFKRQLAAGAWGLTVATPYQATIAAQAGASKIILANQLVGQGNMAIIANLLRQGVAVYCCIDDATNVQQLSAFFSQQDCQLPCLIELGTLAGRCGLRHGDACLSLASEIQQSAGLLLAGLEFYEGIAKDEAGVRQWVAEAAALCLQLQQHFIAPRTALLTGAGSVWYDIVAEVLKSLPTQHGIEVVLRPGCYISHDHQLYAKAQQQVMARSALAQQLGGDLQPALEVAAFVQSLPEPGLAVLGLGKRDIAHDAGMPQVLALYRDGKRLPFDPANGQTERIMDQHCFWPYPADLQLQVGDVVLLGGSHPCLTFDKWRSIWLVDDAYRPLLAMETRF